MPFSNHIQTRADIFLICRIMTNKVGCELVSSVLLLSLPRQYYNTNEERQKAKTKIFSNKDLVVIIWFFTQKYHFLRIYKVKLLSCKLDIAQFF
jgi:hypothetical protein